MKQLIICTSICLGLFFSAHAQEFGKLDKSPLDVVYYPTKAAFRFFEKTPEKTKALEPAIKIYYSRPQKKERKIFGELVPYNELWRTGANEAAEIKFYKNVTIGGTIVKAGNYSFATLPTAEKWTLIINAVKDNWGVYVYDDKKDIAKVEGTPHKAKEAIEAFSISLYEKTTGIVHLKMGWDDTIVEFPIEILE